MAAEEETVERAESTYEFSCNDDTDTISLTDTVKSEYDTDIFQLDCILAEAQADDDDDKMMYLVKWSGWSKYSSTWQYADDFTGDAARTLWEWQEERMRRTRGHKDDFDVDRWQDEKDQIAQARHDRHQKRNKRRKKLGKPVVDYGESEDSDNADDEGDTGMPDASKSKSSKQGDRREMSSESEDEVPLLRRRQSIQDHAKASINSSGKSKHRRPFDDESSDEESGLFVGSTPTPRASKPTTASPTIDARPTRKRRTDAEIQRDKDQTRELLKRKKGVAVAVDKAAKSAAATTSTSNTPAKRTEVKAKVTQSSFFANMAQQRKPSATAAQTDMPPPAAQPGAPVARMVRRAPAAKRPKPNIFTNSSQTSKTRQPTSPDSRRIKSLSHMHHTWKKQRNEAAPDITKLNLYDPSKGKPSSPLQQRTVSDSGAAKNQETILNVEAENPRRAEREEQAAFDSMMHSKMVSPRDKQLALPASTSKQIPVRDGQNHVGDKPWSGLYTCYAWYYQGRCVKGPDCAFEHQFTGRVADHNNRIDPKEMTCLFWSRGTCIKGASCNFAHDVTHYLAQGSKPPARLNPDEMDDVRTCYDWFFDDAGCTRVVCQKAHARKLYIQAGPDASREEKMKGILYADALEAKLARHEYVPLEKLGMAGQQTHNTMKQDTADFSEEAMDLETERSSSPHRRAPRDGMTENNVPLTFTFQQHLKQSGSTTARNEAVMIADPSTNSLPIRLNIAQPELEDQPSLVVMLKLQDRAMYDWMHKVLAHELGEKGPATLSIQTLCIAKVLEKYYKAEDQAILASGDIMASPISQTMVGLLEETLISNAGGAIVHHQRFSMIIFPTRGAEWNFLLKRSGVSSALQFVITTPFEHTIPAQVDDFTSDSAVQDLSISSKLKIDAERLFSSASAKGVFVVLHPDHEDESDLLISALHESKATVYLSNTPGSWLHFINTSKRQGGSIIFHHTFDDFHRVPDLANIVQSKAYKFFSFRINRAAPSLHLSLPRLFPQGRAVLIMDSVWADHPWEAFEVMKWLDGAIKQAPEFYKVLGRPNLLSWLEELALANDDEKRYSLYTMLYSILHQKPDDHNAPKVSYLTKSPSPNPGFPTPEAPVYYQHPSSFTGYEEVFAKNILDAEDLLAEWFSLWALQHVHEFRLFIIVKAGSSARTKAWTELYKHIDVQSPMQYVDRERERNKVKGAKV